MKTSPQKLVYYESMKRKLKIKPMYECRCDGRLQDLRASHTLGWSSHVRLGKKEFFYFLKKEQS